MAKKGVADSDVLAARLHCSVATASSGRAKAMRAYVLDSSGSIERSDHAERSPKHTGSRQGLVRGRSPITRGASVSVVACPCNQDKSPRRQGVSGFFLRWLLCRDSPLNQFQMTSNKICLRRASWKTWHGACAEKIYLAI